MKKKNLKNLTLKKAKVSNLNENEISGGLKYTDYRVCGTGPATIYTCVPTAFTCGTTDTYNSVDRCQTIEVDRFTRPIC